MSTPVIYSRYFDKATAKRGDIVEVTFEVTFLAPINPANVWFDNVGDNLGGSVGVNGPLDWYAAGTSTVTNLSPSSISAYPNGVSSSTQGCMRFWTGGIAYPSTTTPGNVWIPITPLQTCNIKITQKFKVHAAAVIGTVFQVPTRQTPCDDTDFTIGKLMIDLGSACTLSIASGSAPSGFYRTLQIVA
jgi:hypothetical protein